MKAGIFIIASSRKDYANYLGPSLLVSLAWASLRCMASLRCIRNFLGLNCMRLMTCHYDPFFLTVATKIMNSFANFTLPVASTCWISMSLCHYSVLVRIREESVKSVKLEQQRMLREKKEKIKATELICRPITCLNPKSPKLLPTARRDSNSWRFFTDPSHDGAPPNQWKAVHPL